MGQRQLRHRGGGGRGGVADGDAVFLGILYVDVVHAHAAADDELHPGALGRVDVGGADLGLGADHHGVEVTHGFAQGVGLVKLFHDLVAQLLQLGDGGFIHTVGDENTSHIRSSSSCHL